MSNPAPDPPATPDLSDFFNVFAAEYAAMDMAEFAESGADARVLYLSQDHTHLAVASRYPHGARFRYGGSVRHREVFFVAAGVGRRTFADGVSTAMAVGDLIYVRPGIDVDYVYEPGFLDVAFFWSDGEPLADSLLGGLGKAETSD